MAVSEAATRRTQRYFREQRAVRSRALLAFEELAWPLLNPADLRRTWDRFEEASIGIIREQNASSALVAARYYDEFRVLEEIPGQVFPEPVPMAASELKAAALSLQMEGRVGLLTRQALKRPKAVATTKSDVAGSIVEYVLRGGRKTIIQSMRGDSRSLGWARVTSGKPCSFCAVLASRGPVYREATVRFRTHPHCICGAEPVFSREARWPGRGREFRALYDEVAKGEPDPINAFRRAYEAA